MAFDEGLAQRIREHFAGRGDVAEKRMFGGIAFMLDGNMVVIGEIYIGKGPVGSRKLRAYRTNGIDTAIRMVKTA